MLFVGLTAYHSLNLRIYILQFVEHTLTRTHYMRTWQGAPAIWGPRAAAPPANTTGPALQPAAALRPAAPGLLWIPPCGSRRRPQRAGGAASCFWTCTATVWSRRPVKRGPAGLQQLPRHDGFGSTASQRPGGGTCFDSVL